MLTLSLQSRPQHAYLQKTVGESFHKGIQISRDCEMIASKCEELVREQEEVISNIGMKTVDSRAALLAFIEESVRQEDMHLCTDEYTGAINTREESLKSLHDMGYPIFGNVVVGRKLNNIKKTLRKLVELSDDNRRVHPKLSVAVTNRLIYSEPAIMSIRKELVWSVIEPRNEGWELFSVDIKSQEPWILANMLNIVPLKKLMMNDVDFYEGIYMLATGDTLTDKQRTVIKRVWNSITYGAARKTVEGYASVKGAAVYDFLMSMPEYKAYRNDIFKRARNGRRCISTAFGTEIYADESGSKLARSLLDLPIQGSGADILSMLVYALNSVVEQKGLSDYIEFYLSRHDEIVVMADTNAISEQEVVGFLESVMVHQVEGWVPFKVIVSNLSKMDKSKLYYNLTEE